MTCAAAIAVGIGGTWPRVRQSFLWDLGKYFEDHNGVMHSWSEWLRANVYREPSVEGRPGSSIEAAFLFRYEQAHLWPIPPLTESAHAKLQCMQVTGHEFKGNRALLRQAVRDRMLGEISLVTANLGGRAAGRLHRQYALVGFGDSDYSVTRPYWPGIGYFALVLVPLGLSLTLAVSSAVGWTRGVKRSPPGVSLCGRCLYPLVVTGCTACPECGTPVRWQT